MNEPAENSAPASASLLEHQAQRLQALIGEMLHRCQDKAVWQSRRFDLTQAELKCLLLFGEERYLTV